MPAEQTQTEILNITPAAVQAVRDLLQKRQLTGYALRVFVSGVGCSGPQYGMALEANIREEDLTCEYDDVTIVVDEISIKYLYGATVDFISSEAGSGFKIDNPNFMSSCGSSCSGQSSCSGCH